ncbi:DUF3870 domain-containing protein [Peribacillus aracenensis]|uniref:DUF3870 domain-containing protein n=1 Tax=Peribacillus aracenensis TaxID=2976708 RepID=UPI0037C51E95
MIQESIPQGPSMFEIHKNVGIVLEIDKETHSIEDVEVTFITSSSWRFYKSCPR